MTVRIEARGIVNGSAEGPMLSSPAVSFLGDVDIRTGCIVGDLPEVKGVALGGKVLVMPYTRGSAGAWRFVYQLFKLGNHPVAIVTDDVPDPSAVQGAILSGIPMVCAPQRKTAEFAVTGRHVRVHARDGKGVIEID